MDMTMKWDIGMLNKLIGFVFKKNMYITVSNLRNIQKLMNQCNYNMYQSKTVIMRRVEFLNKALKAKLDEKIEDDGLIITYCRTDDDDPVVEDIIKNLPRYKELNHGEIKFIIKFVEDRLNFGIVQDYISQIREIADKLECGEYSTYAQAKLMVDEWVMNYNMDTRKISSSYNEDFLDFNGADILDKVQDMLDRLGNTSTNIITGIQMLNEMLSPGFRPGKIYVFLGLSGGFKSAMLLKIIIDCARYNAKIYRPKKEGHKPVVLYLTMENTKEESFARMYNMAIANDDVENHTAEELVQQLKENGLAHNEEMGIVFVYKANMSISTNDIRGIIDELDAQGKEVVMLSFDYIKRIRPTKKAKDEKEELKNVTNELRNIAIDYLIPVVTAHQMNRAGLATVNNAMRDNKADLARFLGADNVGSAIEVQENADMTIILNLEKRKMDKKLFLTFYRIKERYRPQTRLEYFNQPFVDGNDFMLDDDILTDRKGVISLATDLDGADVEMEFGQRGRKRHNGKTMVLDKNVTEELFTLTPLS